MEYFLKPLNTDYLLQINLDDCIRKYDDPNEICEWIFKTYGDVVNKKSISEKQVLNLVQRILLMRRMGQGKKKSATANQETLFEPDPSRKEEEEFYKSNQNFFKQEEETNTVNADNKKENTQTNTNSNTNSNTNVEASQNSTKNETSTSVNKATNSSALEERNKSYSDEYIKKEIDEVNRVNRYITNEDQNSARMNDNEFKPEILSNYFQSKEKEQNTIESNNNFNYMDEISVESLHSDDEKF